MIEAIHIRYTKSKLLVGVLGLFILFLGHNSLAQRNCGTVEYQQLLKKRNPGLEDDATFENWLKDQMAQKSITDPFHLYAVKEPLVQIPIVVHIVHNGEPYGEGSNITDDQVLSQIDVLNEDFRRQNADTVETPVGFKGVAADSEIEFVLAKQDPEGLPTTGIVRVKGTRTSWNMVTDAELKSLSYWPAEDYMNIWVTTLGGGLLGYAQLPVSNLEGLEGSSTNRLTDGLVIGHQYFGSAEKYPGAFLEAPWNLGRTTSHEVGHFFGLRHIWGDCGCNCDDFVADTPLQLSSTNGCPSTQETCGSPDMFQNYMDYTDDGCMNIFTAGQKGRMRTILDSSPRRVTLPTSHGLNDPVFATLDLGIKEVIEPVNGICSPTITPSIEVRNYGSSIINSAVLELWINDNLEETVNISLALNNLESQTLVFGEHPTPASGTARFEFRIVEVNGIADENPTNNSIISEVIVPVFQSLPVKEDFESFPTSWSIRNYDGAITWEQWQTPSRSAANNAMRLNFHNYGTLGEIDFLITPEMDLSKSGQVDLLFDRAYAYTPGFNNDEMIIAISDDCGLNFNLVVYDVMGIGLATAPNTSLEFIPSGRGDWKRESINLNQFAGKPGVQIAFIGVNGGGNNLYLDNIEIVSQGFIDAGIHSLTSPGFVFCNENAKPVINIENLGLIKINEIDVNYTINSIQQNTVPFTNLDLKSGESIDLALDPLPFGLDEYDLTFQITTAGDIDPGNNSLSIKLVASCMEEIIPTRENFDNIENQGEGAKWKIYDRDADGITWKKAVTTGSSVVFENFQAPLQGLKDYLFSPVLDLSAASKASMFFDVSYAYNADPGELLRIKISTDKGLSYSDVVYEKAGADLSLADISTSWVPSSENDWTREYINLNDYAGKQIMIAFEATGMATNNLYIDNLEFYTDDNPDPLVFQNPLRTYPNPATDGKFNLTFNLLQKENVQIMIFDAMGNEVFRGYYPNTLNQTYPFDLSGNMDGIYLVKTISTSLNQTSRIFINP